jgi:hypothetical protein
MALSSQTLLEIAACLIVATAIWKLLTQFLYLSNRGNCLLATINYIVAFINNIVHPTMSMAPHKSTMLINFLSRYPIHLL